jgi:hypothetical protein
MLQSRVGISFVVPFQATAREWLAPVVDFDGMCDRTLDLVD